LGGSLHALRRCNENWVPTISFIVVILKLPGEFPPVKKKENARLLQSRSNLVTVRSIYFPYRSSCKYCIFLSLQFLIMQVLYKSKKLKFQCLKNLSLKKNKSNIFKPDSKRQVQRLYSKPFLCKLSSENNICSNS